MTNTIAPPTLEELNKLIAEFEARKAVKEVCLGDRKAFDIDLYCLYAVRDGVGAKRQTELEDANNACIELAAKHGYATGHGDTVGDIIREFNAQIPDRAQSPWMDIETAPKDESKILIAFANGHVCEASWHKYWTNPCCGDVIVRTWRNDDDPIAWMPLPAPPTHNSPPEERQCQKCGCATEGEEAWVDGKIWCHPCA